MSINSSPVPLPSYSQSSFPLHACLNASTIVAQPSQDTLDPLKIFVKKQWNPFECGNPAKGAEEKRDNVWSIAINDLITVDIWGTTGKLFGCSECKHKVSSCPHYVTLRNFLIGLPSLPGIEDTKKPESSSGTTKKKPKKRGLAPKDDDTAAPLVLKRLKTKLEEAQKVVKGIERDIVRVRCGAGTKLGECEMEIFGLLDRVLCRVSMSTVDDFVQRMTEGVSVGTVVYPQDVRDFIHDQLYATMPDDLSGGDSWLDVCDKEFGHIWDDEIQGEFIEKFIEYHFLKTGVKLNNLD